MNGSEKADFASVGFPSYSTAMSLRDPADYRAAPTSAAGSPEKQKINDDEGCDYATGAEGEHVANVVSGHALARLDCSFNDPFVVPLRHQGLSLLR